MSIDVQHEEALRLDPSHAAAHDNLDNILQALGRPQDSVAHYQEPLRIQSDLAEAHNKEGDGLQALGRRQETVWLGGLVGTMGLRWHRHS